MGDGDLDWLRGLVVTEGRTNGCSESRPAPRAAWPLRKNRAGEDRSAGVPEGDA
jgi:hypothetical protein